jgi:hypothetical protein
MRLVVTCVLLLGPAVLLVVGLLSLVRDLLSNSAFAAPFSPDDDQIAIEEDTRPTGINQSRPGPTPLQIRRNFGTSQN